MHKRENMRIIQYIGSGSSNGMWYISIMGGLYLHNDGSDKTINIDKPDTTGWYLSKEAAQATVDMFYPESKTYKREDWQIYGHDDESVCLIGLAPKPNNLYLHKDGKISKDFDLYENKKAAQVCIDKFYPKPEEKHARSDFYVKKSSWAQPNPWFIGITGHESKYLTMDGKIVLWNSSKGNTLEERNPGVMFATELEANYAINRYYPIEEKDMVFTRKDFEINGVNKCYIHSSKYATSKGDGHYLHSNGDIKKTTWNENRSLGWYDTGLKEAEATLDKYYPEYKREDFIIKGSGAACYTVYRHNKPGQNLYLSDNGVIKWNEKLRGDESIRQNKSVYGTYEQCQARIDKHFPLPKSTSTRTFAVKVTNKIVSEAIQKLAFEKDCQWSYSKKNIFHPSYDEYVIRFNDGIMTQDR